MKARFIRLDWENSARTIGTAYFKPDRQLYFTAGQYIDLTVPHSPTDARGLTRTMTITSSPDDTLVGITTRLSGAVASSYKQALLDLQPGTSVTLSDAMGDLVLPLDESVPLVFVAGGIGIASYVSMIRWLTTHKDSRNITLFYSVRDTRELIFQDDFDAYASIGNPTKHLYTTDHKADSLPWNGDIVNARLTAADIADVLTPNSQVYISGSQSMVEQLRRELEKDHGIEHYRIVFDYFDGYVET